MSKKEKKIDELGNRMKGYENAYRLYLPKRLPVIIRVDGRAFRTFTKGFLKPFDEALMNAMMLTAKALCEQVNGCKLAYVQSDEISLLVTNDDDLNTQPWFDNNLQKLVSLTASIATLEFNKAFCGTSFDWYAVNVLNKVENAEDLDPAIRKADDSHMRVRDTATFDSRAFIIPKEEIANYFIWRQNDAARNSVQMVAQSLYSHKELQDKKNDDLQEMIFQKGLNWNDFPTICKRGACVIKKACDESNVARRHWIIDTEIPVFTKDRAYIESQYAKEEQV